MQMLLYMLMQREFRGYWESLYHLACFLQLYLPNASLQGDALLVWCKALVEKTCNILW